MRSAPTFHKVNSVSPLDDYKLSVHFWNGTTKIYDVKPWFETHEIFSQLKLGALFDKVAVDGAGYGISWNDDIDLSCDELWENGIEVRTPFSDILSFGDASLIWGLSESTLRKAVAYGKFRKGIDVCKYGKQWLVSLSAMRREYGAPTS